MTLWGPSFDVASNETLRALVESIPLDDGIDPTRHLLDLLDATHKFSPPKHLVEREFASIWRELQAQRETGTVDPEDVGKSDDELATEYRAIAERRVRLGLLLTEISRRNKIKVSKAELEAAGGEQWMRSALLEQKVVAFIFALAGWTQEA